MRQTPYPLETTIASLVREWEQEHPEEKEQKKLLKEAGILSPNFPMLKDDAVSESLTKVIQSLEEGLRKIGVDIDQAWVCMTKKKVMDQLGLTDDPFPAVHTRSELVALCKPWVEKVGYKPLASGIGLSNSLDRLLANEWTPGPPILEKILLWILKEAPEYHAVKDLTDFHIVQARRTVAPAFRKVNNFETFLEWLDGTIRKAPVKHSEALGVRILTVRSWFDRKRVPSPDGIREYFRKVHEVYPEWLEQPSEKPEEAGSDSDPGKTEPEKVTPDQAAPEEPVRKTAAPLKIVAALKKEAEVAAGEEPQPDQPETRSSDEPAPSPSPSGLASVTADITRVADVLGAIGLVPDLLKKIGTQLEDLDRRTTAAEARAKAAEEKAENVECQGKEWFELVQAATAMQPAQPKAKEPPSASEIFTGAKDIGEKKFDVRFVLTAESFRKIEDEMTEEEVRDTVALTEELTRRFLVLMSGPEAVWKKFLRRNVPLLRGLIVALSAFDSDEADIAVKQMTLQLESWEKYKGINKPK